MKILILANYDLGLYQFRRELLEELNKSHEVLFCVPKGNYTESIKTLGCKFIANPYMERHSTNPMTDIKLLRYHFRILKDIKPDVVFTYTIKPNVYGGMACAHLNIPYIANVTGLGTSIENGGLLSKISLTLYRIGLRKARKVFFQNKENRDFMLKHCTIRSAYDLIPGSGVNLETHYVEPYPSDKDGIRFLFVGRIMKDKGIEELLAAIREIHQKRHDVSLDVVGFCDEDYTSALDEAEKEGAIRFYGFQRDIHPFYTKCHCAVLPSYHEGTANVMLEASATGRPVITTKVPGCQETFDEGITGFGCEVRNMESLKNAMYRFLSISQKERECMGLAARKKMEQEYDRNIVLRAYLDEIESITAGMK